LIFNPFSAIFKVQVIIESDRMREEKLALNDPIAALATPLGKSAIAVIRTSGEGAIGLVDRLFEGKKTLSEQAGSTLARGTLVDPASGERIDEALAAVYRAPASYTGEDAVELYCHGGIPTIVRVLSLLRTVGFRDAAPGEFTLRAFSNGKMDLSRAEAVNEIVNARSDRARELALARLSGALFEKIDAQKKKLVEVLGGIEVMIDYPDESYEHQSVSVRVLEEAAGEIGSLLATYQLGKIFQEGVSVAVAGRTNAGKSTLFNLLLKEDRSIVSEQHGTTRDFIEGAITVAGIPIRLFDTAGLRATDHPVEREGIRRTGQLLEGASLVIYIVDATSGLDEADERFFAEHAGGKLIKLWNKIDLDGKKPPAGFIRFSAMTCVGLPELEAGRDRFRTAKAGARESASGASDRAARD
jgi:tRNA modification GTPase